MVDITRTQIGDIVYLNSGSPELTVADVNEAQDTLGVNWLDTDNVMNTATLPAVCFTVIKPSFD